MAALKVVITLITLIKMFRESVDLTPLSLLSEYLTRRSNAATTTKRDRIISSEVKLGEQDRVVGSTMKRSSSSPSSLARAMAILLVIVCCCSLLPFPCSAVCKGRAFGDFGQSAGAGTKGGDQGGGVPAPRGGEDQFDHGGTGLGGGNQVGRAPPSPRGKTPRNHR
ncbi:hypothetical protein VPH35_041892 [Triticum aestivum]